MNRMRIFFFFGKQIGHFYCSMYQIPGPSLLFFILYYRPQRSCGKVIFLHLFVILFTGGLCPGRGALSGGSLSGGLCPGGLCPRGLCPEGPCLGVSVQGVSFWRYLSEGASLARGSLSKGVSVRETPHHMVICGQYASHWNAFLYQCTIV